MFQNISPLLKEINQKRTWQKLTTPWHYIKRSDELYLFWTTLAYYLISVLNLNNKTIFLSLIGLGVIYNLRFKNIRHTLIFTSIASLIFLVGKTWVVQLISPKMLRSTDPSQGYLSFIVITPFQIFTTLLLALIVRDLIAGYSNIREKLAGLFSRPAIVFLCLFFFWQLLSGVVAENIYNLAIIYSLQSLSYLVVFLGVMLYIPSRYSRFSKITSLFGAMAVFEAGLSLFQWLRRSNLGLAVEATERSLTYLEGPGQGFYNIRSIGTFSHPNELGLFSLFMAFLFLPFLFASKKLKLKKFFYLVFFSSSLLTLILSLSRAAWLSFAFCLLLFLYFVEKRWNRQIIRLDRIKTRTLVYVIFFLIVLSPIAISRAVKSFDLFKPTGGGETRLKLIEESLNLIKQKPFFGSGMGLSGYAMFKYNPRGIISTFPSVVHNIFLLIGSESGIPILIFFSLFILFSLKEALIEMYKVNLDNKIERFGVLISLLSFLIFGAMHQIFLMGFFLLIASFLYNIEKTTRF